MPMKPLKFCLSHISLTSLIIQISIFVIASCMLLFSCTYYNEEELYPGSCDTTNITFIKSLDTTRINTTIVSILEVNCYTCHSNVNALLNTNGKDIRLEDYSDVVARANQISQAINHTGPPSVIPMPYNGGKIKQCSITQFDAWVLHGMPYN